MTRVAKTAAPDAAIRTPAKTISLLFFIAISMPLRFRLTSIIQLEFNHNLNWGVDGNVIRGNRPFGPRAPNPAIPP